MIGDNQDGLEKLRLNFRYLNRFMLAIWRLGLGQILNAWPPVFGTYMVLTHTGRKTRLSRKTPLNYAVIGGEIYCTAGFGSISDWYKNIQANPRVEIWLPDAWWTGQTEEVLDPAFKITILRQILINSGFVSRLFGYNPYKMKDAELAVLAEEYRVIHIRRVMPRTGPGGPSELAWVWPLATFILFPMVLISLFRRKQR